MAITAVELSGLNGANGFVLNGIDLADRSGNAVSSAGDVNGDGIDDVIIGARGAGGFPAGQSYVVFGASTGFAASIDLSTLDGSNGFVLNGPDSAYSGYSVSSAGDVNGDGVDDLLIGATSAGQAYVVLGSSTGFAASFNLSALDGSNGFALNGVDANDLTGRSVSSAGDVNDDGINDIIIGAWRAEQGIGSDVGESYVVFGSSTGFAASLDLSDLDGSNGFVLYGIETDDRSGYSVSAAGDVNGDGIDDFVIGAVAADLPGKTNAGESYVVFGSSTSFAASIDLSDLDGTNGFVINGIAAYDVAGASVSSAGDVNGDGIDDLLIGGHGGDPNGATSAGKSYVVFGSTAGFGGSFNLSALNGSNGFALVGIDAFDYSGFSVSGAGDINGDGLDDLLIGARGADPNGDSYAGESYVVFGSSTGFAASINLSALNGLNGFVLRGIDANDKSGYSVSAAGDVNGDGIDDLLIGAFGADPNGGYSGESYVVFGSTLFGANFAPDAQDDDLATGEYTPVAGNVFVDNGSGADSDDEGDPFTVTAVNGVGANVGTQVTLASGALVTVNADGTFNYDPNGAFSDVPAGQTDTDSFTYTISGGDAATVTLTIAGTDPSPGNDSLAGTSGADTINGLAGADTIYGGAENDLLLGGTGFDFLIGGDGDDIVRGNAVGDTIFGLGGDDLLVGGGGIDFLDGGGGADEVRGNLGADDLEGGNGDDVLAGRGGADTLFGEDGADFLTGKGGADTYEFAVGGDMDTIRSYAPGAGGDVILLSGFGAAFDTFAEVMAAMTTDGVSTTITFGGGDVLIVKGVTPGAFDASDFAFI